LSRERRAARLKERPGVPTPDDSGIVTEVPDDGGNGGADDGDAAAGATVEGSADDDTSGTPAGEDHPRKRRRRKTAADAEDLAHESVSQGAPDALTGAVGPRDDTPE